MDHRLVRIGSAAVIVPGNLDLRASTSFPSPPARNRGRWQAEVVRAVELVIAVVWAVFWLSWLAAAFSTKRGRVPWSRELGIRVVIVAVVNLLVRLGAFRHQGRNTDAWRAGLGLALLGVGLGFANWARIHIGRNWGMPMTLKDEPDLVSRGPLPPGSPPDLLGHLGRSRRHRGSARLDVADRSGLGRDLLPLQRPRRGALHGQTVSQCLPRVPALDQDAHPVCLLIRTAFRSSCATPHWDP